MKPIIRSTLAVVISELKQQGWQRNGKICSKPPFTLHHPIKSKLAAIVQQMPIGKGRADFEVNW